VPIIEYVGGPFDGVRDTVEGSLPREIMVRATESDDAIAIDIRPRNTRYLQRSDQPTLYDYAPTDLGK
jgi:hypothetical protein